jgi:HSP20 family protein
MNRMIPWNPWREMRALQRAAQRVADGAWGEPAIDMYETDGQVVVTASVPGLAPADLDIKLVGNTLTIKSEVQREQEHADRTYAHRERRFGSFSRVLTVPKVDADQITAEMQYGVFTLTLPKAQAVKARSIAVKPS